MADYERGRERIGALLFQIGHQVSNARLDLKNYLPAEGSRVAYAIEKLARELDAEFDQWRPPDEGTA